MNYIRYSIRYISLNKTHLNIRGADLLAIKATHSFDGAITILKVYKGIVFNFLNAFHLSILLKLLLFIKNIIILCLEYRIFYYYL